ncbi:uncharacterized protein Tco025E_07873 [Trypanosoma conorhini]|uniref:Uncharacterized protein n=1 Tax=Trypanosoma conorhini TaxID=83891 RepID=A0A3R7NDX4_9TRYP|nr:uncharacterized protein Tco025E_07873 [Trypanosoma conorhini]RNF05005.1 hypothetical protein Tco025E_07873 [Trypanosoma conorhini]
MGNTDNAGAPSSCWLASTRLCVRTVQHGGEEKHWQQQYHHPYQVMESDWLVTGKRQQKLLSPSPRPDALPDSAMVAASTRSELLPMGEGRQPLASLSKTITTSICKDDAVQHLIEALSTSSWSSSEEAEEPFLDVDARNWKADGSCGVDSVIFGLPGRESCYYTGRGYSDNYFP